MRRLAIILLIAITLAGCAKNNWGPPMDAPTWSVGHTWTYESTVMAEGAGNEFGGGLGEGTSTQVVTVLHPLELEGVDGWLVQQEEDGRAWSSLSAYLFIDNATLTETQISSITRSQCNMNGCGSTLEPRIWDSLERTSFLPFPLTAGKQWTYHDVDAEYNARATGKTVVDVPAGHFAAAHIQYSYGVTPAEVAGFRKELESEGIKVHRYDVQLQQRMDVYYAPLVENVVLERAEFSATYDVDIEYEGQRHTDSGSATLSSERVLQSFELAEDAPMTDDELLISLGYQPLVDPAAPTPPLAPPPGQNPAPDDAPMVTITGADDVNLHDEQSVALAADAVGSNGPYSHSWTVLHEDEYAWNAIPMEGRDIDVALDKIGRYTYRVDTYDRDGAWAGRTEGGFDVFYATAIDGSCQATIGALSIGGDCDAVTVPVGLRSAHWQVEATLEGGLRGSGHLQIISPSGYVLADKTMSGGKATIDTIDGFEIGAYTVKITPPDGLEEMPITIDVRVGSAA